MRLRFKPVLLTALLLLGGCKTPPLSGPAPPAELGAGLSSPRPDIHLSTALSPATRLEHSLGASFFNKPWVSAPSTTSDRDGLGPLFNAHSCSGCHIKHGRGQPFQNSTDESSGLIFRLYPPGNHLGAQLQNRALPGFTAEPRVRRHYRERTITFADGFTVTLREPVYRAANLPETVTLSPRLAPPLTGMGLIDALNDDDIIAGADPDDRDGDGISGRVHRTARGPGRFGWKAEVASLNEQVARAFVEDIGISSPAFPQEPACTPPSNACLAISGGVSLNTPELDNSGIQAVSAYLSLLSVPTASHNAKSPGWQLFQEANCHGCHRPGWQTGPHTEPLLNRQSIFPFSDFLLHDMGPALSDQSDTELAGEWRTAPLWGLDTGPYLHDGRARSLLEAILWHGGEAQASVDTVLQFDSEQRRALLEFLDVL